MSKKNVTVQRTTDSSQNANVGEAGALYHGVSETKITHRLDGLQFVCCSDGEGEDDEVQNSMCGSGQ